MSKKSTLFLLSAALLLVSVGFKEKPLLAAQNDLPRTTWLWDTSQIAEQPERILSFLVEHHVKSLYLQINEDIPDAIYHDFIREASKNNIEVHALDGAPNWATSTKPIQSFFGWLENYQAGSDGEERFKGVHLDIEPYLLPRWHTANDIIVKQYQRSISLASLESSRLGLQLGIDIPFWFDDWHFSNLYGTGILSEWLIDQTDAVTIMAYRNEANGQNGIIKLSEEEIGYSERAGKPVRIGIETAPSLEGDYLSFAGKNDAYMEEQLQRTQYSFRDCEQFEGFAIHSLESWLNRH